MGFFNQDLIWMGQALQQARQAAELGEVPVGAVLVSGETLLAAAGNQPIQRCDPTAHAEILVLREAAIKQQSERLSHATLYVTLEPCPMCFGAMVQARVKRVVFAAFDVRMGALGSMFNLLQANTVTWRPDVMGGVCAEEAAQLLQTFFKQRRHDKH